MMDISFIKTHSPHLGDLWDKHHDWYQQTILSESRTAKSYIQNLCAEIEAYDIQSLTEPQMMHLLRLYKQKSSLVIALDDVFNHPDIYETTHMLSDVATALIGMAFKWAIDYWIKKDKILLPAWHKGENSGLIIVGMGKLGANELNYSSDVDFCVFYDSESALNKQSEYCNDGYIRATQTAVKLLSERTIDGYVYRCDLRLRPDPLSTKIAVSFAAAELYYQRSGQNWERAAWIKSRLLAGDVQAWQAFQTMMRPFIWRKNLDYAAIQDIQSIKRQLHTHYKQADLKVAGHDIKIGKGGIREIELFCQTQQLIGGGRDLRLRCQTTFEALESLTDKGWITQESCDILKKAYRFYRILEHRLQMVDDKQTHLIPTDPQALLNVALFCGFNTVACFEKQVVHYLQQVSHVCDALFAREKPLTLNIGNLVFTGHDDDPATLKSLAGMGYQEPQKITEMIRRWHFGVHRSMHSSKARELLTEITPLLLSKVARLDFPDKAMVRLDDFLSHLTSSVSFFSYMLNSDSLMNLFVDIMGKAPDFGEYLARYPETFDIMMDGNFYQPPQTVQGFLKEFSYRASPHIPLDKLLNLLRRFTREQKFRIGIACLKQYRSYDEVSHLFGTLAESCLHILMEHMLKAYADEYDLNLDDLGHGLGVIAMGSFGAKEMTLASDLDLLMVYDDAITEKIDDAAMHYNRLGQRILSSLTIHTQDGMLYDVDMRLRPSGNSGPLVVSHERFENYQKNNADTWEHLALVRGRVVYGSPIFAQKLQHTMTEVLCLPRQRDQVVHNTLQMRQKLLTHRQSESVWDVKLHIGGMFDISFLLQASVLIYAHDDRRLQHTNSAIILSKLYEYDYISQKDYAILSQAWDLYQDIHHYCAMTKYKNIPAHALEQELVFQKWHLTETMLVETYQQVREIFGLFFEKM